jgi:hypothetical protein
MDENHLHILLAYHLAVIGKPSALTYLLIDHKWSANSLTLDDLKFWVWAQWESPEVSFINIQVWLRV